MKPVYIIGKVELGRWHWPRFRDFVRTTPCWVEHEKLGWLTGEFTVGGSVPALQDIYRYVEKLNDRDKSRDLKLRGVILAATILAMLLLAVSMVTAGERHPVRPAIKPPAKEYTFLCRKVIINGQVYWRCRA
jgi:hypothetical protein